MRSLLKSALVAWVFLFAMSSAHADQEYGIFERILAASGDYTSTVAAFEKALAASSLTLHAKRDIYVPEGKQRAKIYIVTSPAYMAAAAGEEANTASAQILRIGIYEYGPGKKTFINMANPVAHAHVFYSEGDNLNKMLAAANKVAAEIRAIAAQVPGTPERKQLEPIREVDALEGFNGDGPAKMMTGFSDFEGNQNPMVEDEENFAEVVAKVEKAIKAAPESGDVDESSGWTLLTKIQVNPNAVYFGIINDYTQDRTLRINSDFRSDGKTDDAPIPGVDHITAMPMEVLVLNMDGEVSVIQYGEMWRMQLYFWDSGYLAFTKNAIIPAIIESAIEEAVGEDSGLWDM
ncbi:MAG: hypothetical protein GXP22_01845 [Gammaproteobacteria bacterium]|nr:hypothetical protein [Gammaproteobacteria bacterium]